MERIIEVGKEYRKYRGTKAIAKFFETHKELNHWKEQFEWMLENNIDFVSDNIMNDGTRNKDWRYALHLDNEYDYTYICIIERA